MENGDGSPSRARQGRVRTADGLSTRTSLIVWSRNCQTVSPPGLHPHPLVRGAPSPLLLDPQTTRCACCATKMFLKKWVRRQVRRGCSDEGEWEGQELTFECVLTTPIRSLAHKHYSFKYVQDRHVHRRAWNWKSSTHDHISSWHMKTSQGHSRHHLPSGMCARFMNLCA